MSTKSDFGPSAAVSRLADALGNWWRRSTELGGLPAEELDRIAGELGMRGSDLEELSERGPHAADLLYQRMSVLGLSPSDVEGIAHSLMRDLQRTCSNCHEKGTCRKDLAAHPGDPVWQHYCPNAISLESVRKAKANPTLGAGQ